MDPSWPEDLLGMLGSYPLLPKNLPGCSLIQWVRKAQDAPRVGRQGRKMSQQEGQAGRIGPIKMPDYLRPTYANFINVNHTPWDFRLQFALLRNPAPGEISTQPGEVVEVRPEAVADLIIPANLVHGLIAALRTSFDAYITTYGAPGLNPEGPAGPQEGGGN